MINPGSMPVEGADEQLAERNVDVFLSEARERGALVAGPAVRDPDADRDGRFGWDLPMADESVIRLLMPGAELIRVRDDLSALSPCLYLNGDACWWPGAVGLVASTARWSTRPRSAR